MAAEFLPRAYARLGRRLVFSHGIFVLTILSAILLVVFGGVTDRLIPLFAVGAFTAFLLSQVGMVLHWAHQRHRAGAKLGFNAVGAATTGIALAIIVIEKFAHGAWMVLVIGPALVLLLRRIRRHYDRITREIEQSLPLSYAPLRPPITIVPVEGWNRPAEKALRFALRLSSEVIALHVSVDEADSLRMRKIWRAKVETGGGRPHPRLEIVDSPYRRVHEPIVEFVRRTDAENPGRLVAVVLPQLADPRWYEELLHNLESAGLKTQLDIAGSERTFVIYVPWHLREV